MAQTSTTRVASGLASPLFARNAPGDSQRLFLLEQGNAGTARIKTLNLATGAVSTYLTISGLQTNGERGLLGLAFHPDFANNGQLYVNVTASNQTQIRRYTAVGDPVTSTSADPASLQHVMRFNQPFSNHNAGWIGFNPNVSGNDAQYLYVATGDGGSGGDPQNNSQDITNNRLGKMLRIDVDGDDFPASSTANYAIPPSNPFVGATGDDEIWSYGLRNPFRNSFDRKTGDLWIADVGQNAIEEINFQPASSPGGENYGWRVLEGNNCFDNSGADGNPRCNFPGFVDPVHTYPHTFNSQGGFSVTGGYVYRGSVDRFEGQYFFADYLTNNIWSIDPYATNVSASVRRRNSLLTPNAGTISGIAGFGEDANGDMYLMSHGNGNVFRVTTTAQRATWNGATAVGNVGDGSNWNDANNWTRGSSADVGPAAGDTVVFPNRGVAVQSVDLGGSRSVAALQFGGNYALDGGSLQVLSGNVSVDAGVAASVMGDLSAETSAHSLRKMGGGALWINGSAGQTVILEGTLGGNGDVAVLRALEGTTVAPGNSAGELSIGTDVVFESGSRLHAEIGGVTQGTEYDHLQVGRNAELAGSLVIETIQGYSPLRGAVRSFALVSSANQIGTFDEVTYNGLVLEPVDGVVQPDGSFVSLTGNGLFQTVDYDRNQVVLEQYLALPGDANGDGVVDVSDFNLWNLNKFESGTDWMTGDFNGDGVTDVSDFNIWNLNKFSAVPRPVPEPVWGGAWVLLLGAAAARQCGRRQRERY